MDLRGKRLALIGGAGLIGSHTVDQLLQHDVAELRIYDDFSRGTRANLEQALRDPRVRIFEAGGNICHVDLLNAALKGVDGVFHFAALWLLQCAEFPRAAFEVNVGGLFNVLEACVQQGVSRLVFSSSASVYGDAEHEPMTEDHPFNNRSLYGATKIAGEALARAFHHQYGLRYVGLRYMNVYGPRQDYRGAYVAVVMRMLDSIDRGEPIIIHGDGSQSYDFVYVGDCARANLLAMQAETADRCYNVGTGAKTSLLALSELVQELTGSYVGVIHGESNLLLVKNRVGCPRRAAEELGFEAATELRSGLKLLIDWYCEGRGIATLGRPVLRASR
jgi:UDP-glucose 4-epimerase